MGFTALILVTAFVKHEAGYDQSFEDSERTYRVIRNWKEDKIYGSSTPVPFLEEFKAAFPQVENGTRLWAIGAECVVYKDKVFYDEEIIAVDSSFIKTFNLKLSQGNKKTALNGPQKLLISEKIKRKYFPAEDPIGKTLVLEGGVYSNNNGRFTVTGVFETFPAKNHFKADFLISLYSFGIANWTEHRSHNLVTYVKLKKPTDKKLLEAQLPDFMYDFYGKEYYEYARSVYKLQPVADIHLDTSVNYNSYEKPKGNYSSLYIFPLLALLIFIIALINYIFLTIAENKKRRISFGINKLNGAGKNYLWGYFMRESLFLNVLALVFAIVLTNFLVAPFQQLVERSLDFSFFYEPVTIIIIIAFISGLGLINGFILALKFSKKTALQLIHDNTSIVKRKKSIQPAFQVIQLTICILLLSGSMIVYKQLSFINNKLSDSIKNENVLVIKNLRQLKTKRASFKQELLKLPEITSASVCNNVPGISYFSHWGHPVDSAAESIHIAVYRGDHDYLQTLGFEMIKGRFFDPTHPADNHKLVLNETAAKQLGWNDPIGKRYGLDTIYHVIGVAKDFHFVGLQEQINPLGIFLQSSDNGYMMLVKISGKNPAPVIDKMKSLWTEYLPGRQMRFSFLNDELSFWYKTERKTGTFGLILSLIAILLSSMGLMAILWNETQNRIKEIGIRKVNGAQIINILTLLNTGIVKLIAIAFVVATPIAWYTMRKWLQHFAYKTELSLWIFGIAGLITLLIALLTVSYQSWSAASKNPVEALRYE
jgi:putative ABC transport system permease protein